MATKADFTEDEWAALQRGVTGSGMLVSLSDPDFTEGFGEAHTLSKFLAAQHQVGATELVREVVGDAQDRVRAHRLAHEGARRDACLPARLGRDAHRQGPRGARRRTATSCSAPATPWPRPRAASSPPRPPRSTRSRARWAWSRRRLPATAAAVATIAGWSTQPQAPSPAAPPGRATSRRRCGTSSTPRPAARSSCSGPRSPRSSGRTSAPGVVRLVLDDADHDHARRLVARPGRARLGQQRADGVLLLRRRPRGAARVRHGRAARAPARRPAGARRVRRDGSCRSRSTSRSTRAARRRTAGGPRCPPTRRSRSARSRSWDARCPGRLRVFLLTVVVVDDVVALLVIATAYTEHVVLGALAVAVGAVRASCSRCASLGVQRGVVYLALRARDLGRALQVGRRPADRRARDGAAHLGVPGRARRPRARDRAVPLLPRAADPGARALGPARRRLRDLAQRAAPAAAPPVDELRDRARVRARQRGDRDRRRLPRARDHAHRSRSGSSSRYVVGKPVGIVAACVARDARSRRLRPPVSWPGLARQRRRGAGSGSPCRCSSRASRSRASGWRRRSSACSPPRSARRRSWLARLQGDRRCSRRETQRAPGAGHGRVDRRPRGAGRPRARPHPRARTRPA